MNRHSRNARFPTALIAMAMIGCFAEAAGTATEDNPAGTSAARKPVKYIATEKSNIGNEMIEAGDSVMYAGLPAENLTPTCDEGRARYKEYLASNADRVKQMVDDAKGTDLAQLQQELMVRLAEKQIAATEAQGSQIASAVAQAVVAAMAQFFPNGVPAAAAPAATEEAPKTKK